LHETGKLEENATSPGCAACDDLMLGRGQEAPENHPLIVVRGFFCRLVAKRNIHNAVWVIISLILI
jgi:hypothetical protein